MKIHPTCAENAIITPTRPKKHIQFSYFLTKSLSTPDPARSRQNKSVTSGAAPASTPPLVGGKPCACECYSSLEEPQRPPSTSSMQELRAGLHRLPDCNYDSSIGCPLWHLIILRAYCRPCVPFLQTSSFTRDPFTVHGSVGSDASRTRVSNAAFVGTDGAIDEDAATAIASSDDGCKQRLRLRAATGAAEGIRATT